MADVKSFRLGAIDALHDAGYTAALNTAIAAARTRLWINMFYIGVAPRMDQDFHSRRLLELVAEKAEDGLNVKVLLGTQDLNSPLEIQNGLLAHTWGSRFPVRFYASDRRQYSHSKYVLIDEDQAVVGSHNWSHRSLAVGRDDSVRVVSPDLAEYLSNDFHRKWVDSRVLA